MAEEFDASECQARWESVQDRFDARKRQRVRWGPDVHDSDPEHPLTFIRSVGPFFHALHPHESVDEYYDKLLLEHFKEALKRHGKTLKEVAAAWGIDYRMLEKRIVHPEKLTADEVERLCKFIGCEPCELGYWRDNDEETFVLYTSLNDYHKEVVQTIVWSLWQAEDNVNNLADSLNQIEDETGDTSRLEERHSASVAHEINRQVARIRAEHPEGSDEK